jgi:hypothetical protein
MQPSQGSPSCRFVGGLHLLKHPTPTGDQHRLKKGQPLLGKGLAKLVDFSSYNLLTGGFHQ